MLEILCEICYTIYSETFKLTYQIARVNTTKGVYKHGII